MVEMRCTLNEQFKHGKLCMEKDTFAVGRPVIKLINRGCKQFMPANLEMKRAKQAAQPMKSM